MDEFGNGAYIFYIQINTSSGADGVYRDFEIASDAKDAFVNKVIRELRKSQKPLTLKTKINILVCIVEV